MFSVDSVRRTVRGGWRNPGNQLRRSGTVVALLALAWGCSPSAPSAPGETFVAGYVFADRQQKVTHTFEVINPTTVPVSIRKVERSCSCAGYDLEKYHLKPGEVTRLTINVDVPKTYMLKSATCVLKTDNPSLRDWPYTVKFMSLPFVVAEPNALDLGSFDANSQNWSVAQPVTIDLFAETKVTLNPDDFTVPDEIELITLSEPDFRRLGSGIWKSRYQLSIGLTPRGHETVLHSTRSGVATRALRLIAGAAKAGEWQYSVYWRTSPSLACDPGYVSFGNLLDSRETHTRRATISSTTNQKFGIVSVANQSPDIVIDATFDGSNTLHHHVSLHAPRFANAEAYPTGNSRRFVSGTI